MMPLTRNHRIGLAVAATGFVADQVMKWLVNGPLGLDINNESLPLIPFFSLTRASNYGISLGLLTAQTDLMRWGLVALTAFIAAIVAIWMTRERKLGEIIPLGLILGGALGNIVDRVRVGHVIDYADFHIGTWRPFLIFNLADALITVGVVIILARSLLIREKPANETAGAPATEN